MALKQSSDLLVWVPFLRQLTRTSADLPPQDIYTGPVPITDLCPCTLIGHPCRHPQRCQYQETCWKVVRLANCDRIPTFAYRPTARLLVLPLPPPTREINVPLGPRRVRMSEPEDPWEALLVWTWGAGRWWEEHAGWEARGSSWAE